MGILDTMGSILAEYQPEPSHMDLTRTNFHGFVPNLAFFNVYIIQRLCVAIWRQKPALAWLAGLLYAALALSDLGLPCLPCLGLLQQQQQPAAFSGRRPASPPLLLLLLNKAKARQGRHRPDQAKAGHNRQASQAKAGFFLPLSSVLVELSLLTSCPRVMTFNNPSPLAPLSLLA